MMRHTTLSSAARLVSVCAVLASIVQPSVAQEETKNAKNANTGVLGFLDPKTGAFRPVVPGEPALDNEQAAAAAAATAATTGKFVFNITITVASAIPASQQINCLATASTDEVNSKTFTSSNFIEEASIAAKRTGSTATCSVLIPYSWNLATPSSDTVSLAYTISSYGASGVQTRTSTQTLAQIKVPTSGATSTETIKATI